MVMVTHLHPIARRATAITVVAASAFVVGSLLGACGTSHGALAAAGTPAAFSASPADSAAMKAILVSEATRFGDPSPTDLELASTTSGRSIEAAAPGTQTSGDPARHVYTLVAHGSFTSSDGPSMSPPVTGPVLILTVDATTQQVIAETLTGADPDWTNLGAELHL